MVRVRSCPFVVVRAWLRPKARLARCRAGAFTLIELLVVTAIIAMLAVDPPPSRASVFLDEHQGSTENARFVSTRPGTLSWVDHPATRHNGGGVLSLADGHAEAWKWHLVSAVGTLGLTESAFPSLLPRP